MFCRIVAVGFSGILMLAPILFPRTSAAQQRVHQKPKRLWTASLKLDADWKERRKTKDANSFGLTRVEVAGDYVFVSFLHSQHLEHPPGYGGLMEPLRFKTLVFSAKDGSQTGVLYWQARRRDAALLPIHDGGFIVHAGDILMRYSPSLELMGCLDLPPTEPAPHYRSAYSEVEMLQGGRILFLRTYKKASGQLHSHGSWISVDSFERIGSTLIPDWRPVVPTFDTIVQSERSSTHIRESDRWSAIFYSEEVYASLFLAKDLLLLTGRRKVIVIDTTGKERMSADLNVRDPKISKRSLRGNRFAVFDTSSARPFRWGLFDARFTAKVFDVGRRGLIAKIELGIHDAGEVDLALSEDGAYLATLTGTRLSFFKLAKP